MRVPELAIRIRAVQDVGLIITVDQHGDQTRLGIAASYATRKASNSILSPRCSAFCVKHDFVTCPESDVRPAARIHRYRVDISGDFRDRFRSPRACSSHGIADACGGGPPGVFVQIGNVKATVRPEYRPRKTPRPRGRINDFLLPRLAVEILMKEVGAAVKVVRPTSLIVDERLTAHFYYLRALLNRFVGPDACIGECSGKRKTYQAKNLSHAARKFCRDGAEKPRADSQHRVGSHRNDKQARERARQRPVEGKLCCPPTHLLSHATR